VAQLASDRRDLREPGPLNSAAFVLRRFERMVDCCGVLTPEVVWSKRDVLREIVDACLWLGRLLLVRSLTRRRAKGDQFVERTDPIAREAHDIARRRILLRAYVGFVRFQPFPAVFTPPWPSCPCGAVFYRLELALVCLN
jgi:hypothetical protein